MGLLLGRDEGAVGLMPKRKRVTWKKNGPTKRVEVQILGPKAAKAAAAQKRKG